MPLSKKYYNRLVKLICSCDCSKTTEDEFIDYLKSDNSHFSETKFRSAIKKCNTKR